MMKYYNPIITLQVESPNGCYTVDLPVGEQELADFQEEIGIRIGEKVELVDIYAPKELSVVDERIDLDEMNFLAMWLDQYSGDELRCFCAAAQAENRHTVGELIQLAGNLRRYQLVRDTSDLVAIGREYYMIREGGLSMSQYEDTAAMQKQALELIKNHDPISTEFGLLYRFDDIPEEAFYDGKHLPEYHQGELATVILTTSEGSECVYLPTAPVAIDKAMLRLGVQSARETTVSVMAASDALGKVVERLATEESVEAANRVVTTLEEWELNDMKDLFSEAEQKGLTHSDDLVRLAKYPQQTQAQQQAATPQLQL